MKFIIKSYTKVSFMITLLIHVSYKQIMLKNDKNPEFEGINYTEKYTFLF